MTESLVGLKASLRDAATSLDDDSIPWKSLVLYLVLGVYAFETWLSARQYKCYSYPSPPASLAKHVDIDTYRKSQSYGRDKARFGFVAGVWGLVNALVVIYFDLMPLVWSWSGQALRGAGIRQTEITQSIAFTFIFSLIRETLDMPLSYYSHFVLEEAHGFNKMTRSTFVLDFFKGLAIGVVFMGPLIAGLIAIIRWAGTEGFVFWVLVFVAAFQIILQILYPTVIQPLFNKLTPLADGPLKSRVQALASTLRFPLAKIYQIDGSKRSAHSNAYFFGVLPWTNKHIVIFDTLLNKSTCSEIEAILAHELGHWKNRDPTKLLVLAQVQIAMTFTVFAVFIDNRSLFKAFGFSAQPYLPIIIGLELFQMVVAPLDSVLKFVNNSAVRRMEYAADAFAARTLRPAFDEAQIDELQAESQTASSETGTAADKNNDDAEKERVDAETKTAKDAPKVEPSPSERLELELSQVSEPYDELLAKALIKLHVQNLSTFHYDALYSAYNHSHPTLPERLAALQKLKPELEKERSKGESKKGQ